MITNPSINQETLTSLKETMGEVFEDLKQIFIEDSAELLKKIKAGLDNDRLTDIAEASHTLKSSAKNMGADKLAAYCVQIEYGMKTDNKDKLKGIYQCAVSEMLTFREFLKSS